jgi:1-acyl-sn-glycerol-3-phosphate acyltransferase
MILLRSTLFNVFFFGVTFLMTLFLATPLRFVAPQRVLDIARLWARIMVWAVGVICGIRLRVFGAELLNGENAKLIAPRHQSAFDTLVWLTLLPRCCYVLKQELLHIPLFGPLLPLAGMIAVDRAGGATALRGLLREGERAALEGRQIVIFPEGTRGAPDAVLPLQPGVAALAALTHLPVIPAVTDSGLCWSRRAFHKRPGTIHIRLLEPIPAGTAREPLMRRLDAALRSGVVPPPGAVENSVG